MDTGVCILDIILQQQTSRIDIQVFGQGVRQHIDLQERNQLCGAATQGSFTNFAIASSTGSGGSLYSSFSMRSRFQIWV